MANEEFEEGDTVMLKSGGPVMTINEQLNADVVVCIWFDRLTQHQGEFNPKAIKKVNPADYM